MTESTVPGGPYKGFRKMPAEHLRRAEQILVDHGPDESELLAMDWPTTVLYADALIALASAMIRGSNTR